MKTCTITRRILAVSALMWTVFFALLSITNFNTFEVLNIVGFLFLSILPGLLTVIAIRLRGLPTWGYICTVIGFSLLELMLVGLLGNTLLPFIGITRPLDKNILLIEIPILIGFLTLWAYMRMEPISINVKKYIFFDSGRDTWISFFPILFVILSIFGAIRLNNGASNISTMIMLGSIGLFFIIILNFLKNLDENAIPTAIFFISLALLLMTSMRGWYITGHDIQREYKVFELTKLNGLWSMAAFRDAYNACLSITILPTIFSNLLHVLDQYIFKLFFQIFFALCPPLVYLISRREISRLISFLGVIFFISFPTFFTDMPFLVRQEIAFIFYGSMLYLIFNSELNLRFRQLLFFVMGIGVIISHYSTTYTILFIFALAVLARPFFIKLSYRFKDNPIHNNSAILLSSIDAPKKSKINFILVIGLIILSFLWTSVITNTGNGLSNVISQAFIAVENGFGGENRSIDAIGLLSFGKLDINQEVQQYIQTVINPIRNKNTSQYFSETIVDKYPIKALPDETLSLTVIGKFFYSLHINIILIISILGQILAKAAEAIIPIGIVYLLFRNQILKKIDIEFYLIAFFCLVFVGMNIVLPVLSVQYGIFRAIQQSMFVIAPIMVVGSLAVGKGFKWTLIKIQEYSKNNFVLASRLNISNFDYIFVYTFTIVFFLYSTAFLPQIFGGNIALLHLNNDGTYYDNFLIQTREVEGINWLSNLSQNNPKTLGQIQFEVQSDRFSSSKLSSISNLSPFNDIFPSVVRKDSYLYLSTSNIVKNRASIVFHGDRLVYSYPIEFLNVNKNLIYNNGGSRVYK